MTVAEIVEPIIRSSLGGEAPVKIHAWDGSVVDSERASAELFVNSPRALRRILWAPNELGVARAYVSGDITIDGDLLAALADLERVASPEAGPSVGVDAATKRAVVSAVIKLRAIGLPPKPPEQEARFAGRRHSRRRDAAAIAHHYDVGNDFYRLVLGESMTYSCAYWPEPPGPGFGLADAQFAKCDLVARKLGLSDGMRVLDVGCGWGTFALHAARTYGARVVGITLSQEQAGYATKRMADEGVADLVEIRVQDYRDVDDGPYDAISSIGMAEHVGATMLPHYARSLLDLLRPQGRLLNHAISRRPGPRRRLSRTSFIDRYVFPDGELQPLDVMVGCAGEGRFRGPRRRVAARALRADPARVGGQPRAELGRGGPARGSRAGTDMAALHGRLGAGVRRQPDRAEPGPRSADRIAR